MSKAGEPGEAAPPSGPSGETARIADRGYQHYTGPRRGPALAVQTIAVGTARRSLGFKRPTSAKILPFILVAATYIPAVAVVGFRLLFPSRVIARLTPPDQLLRYSNYFNELAVPVLVLAALAASEALCPDRRQRVLALYYASPIRPGVYLLGQAIGVIGVLLLVTIAPPLLLWAANVLLADNALTYGRDHLDQAVRIVASGALIASFNAALALAVAAYTDRRAYAAGSLLGGVLLLSAVTGIVRGTVHAGWGRYSVLVDPRALPVNAMYVLFGQRPLPHLSGVLYVGGALVVACAAAELVRLAYREVQF